MSGPNAKWKEWVRPSTIGLRLAQLAFWQNLSSILEGYPGWVRQIVSGTLALALSLLLKRGHVTLQVLVRHKRRWLGAGFSMLLIGAGSVLAVRVWDRQLASLRELDPCHPVLGFLIGFTTARAIGQATSPLLVESAAGGRQARLFVLLAFLLLGLPRTSTLALAVYLASIGLGVAAHRIQREMRHRLKQTGTNRVDVVPANVTPAEWAAIKALGAGRPRLAKKMVAGGTSFASDMIQGAARFALRQHAAALTRTLRAIEKAPDPIEMAKAHVLAAAVYWELGDAARCFASLSRVKALDPSCVVAPVAETALIHAAPVGVEGAESDMLRVFRAQALARRPKSTVGDYLVAIAFNVTPEFFIDALATSMLAQGYMRYALELSDRVLEADPDNAIAQLHRGLIVEKLRNDPRPDIERKELFDVAMIAFELAIRLSPEDSVTAQYAAAGVRRLRDRDGHGDGGGDGGQPYGAEAAGGARFELSA